jgi:BlaI family transcriptional regulator, penicillinase repressor
VDELSLPDAELDVMACLWDRGPQTARAIREALQPRRPMTHASISTLLKRLMEKRYVVRTKAATGKAFVFQAAKQPQATRRHLVSDLLDRIFGGSGVALMSTLLEAKALTPEEVEAVAALLEESRGTADLRAPNRAPKAGSQPKSAKRTRRRAAKRPERPS